MDDAIKEKQRADNIIGKTKVYKRKLQETINYM
jgi:hypothetical protein